jgi:hypothetical protein
MNPKLDILIEKYLDGNISKKDETELKKIIESDVESRKSFQNANTLQKLFKQDALGIEYPEELFSDVQDMILMKYLQEAPQESTVFVDLKNAYPKQIYTYARYAAVIAIFFLASIISINEFMPLYNPVANKNDSVLTSTNPKDSPNAEIVKANSNELQTSVNVTTTSDRKSTEATPKKEFSTPLLKTNNFPSEITLSSSTEFEQSAPILEFAELPQLITLSETESSYNYEYNINGNNSSISNDENYNSLNALNLQNSIPNLSEFRDFNQLNFVPTYNFGLDQLGLNKINFVATASNGFASFGLQLADNVITSFSQSVSYDIDKKSTIGVELGLTQFSAKVLRDVVLVSQNNSDFDDDFTGKDLIRVKLPLKQKMQLVWTTIFYERTLLQLKNSEVSARLGLGLTDSDPLYMAKILGKQRLYRDLFLTIGVDARYYKTSINGTINGNYLSTFNIIYGLQYSL